MRASSLRVCIAIVLFVLIDRAAKYWAATFWQIEPVPLFSDWAMLTYFQNPSLAFGIPLTGWPVVATVAVVTAGVGGTALWHLRQGHDARAWGWFILFAGAASNLYDRLRYGFVIDYVMAGYLPVFNLADVAIMAGALFIAFFLWREYCQS